MNGGFWDLPAEVRAEVYARCEQETGQQFLDLPPEERGKYYDAWTLDRGQEWDRS